MARKFKLLPKVLVVALLLTAVYFILRRFEYRVLYQPDSLVTATPAKIGLPFDNVVVRARDGLDIRGWLVPAVTNELATADQTPAPMLLFFHDATGNLADRLDKLSVFHQLGFSVCAIDYRGYGKSDGLPSEEGLHMDAQAAYYHLIEKGFTPSRLLLYGEGLGAAVAIRLATTVRAAGLITEGAFASMPDLLKEKRPQIPWRLFLHDRYSSLEKIRRIRMPVLLIHSADDEVAPFEHSEWLHAAAQEPKRLVQLTGTHREAFVTSFDVYADALDAFAAECLKTVR